MPNTHNSQRRSKKPSACAAILKQTRQHHAIEHATIHLLSARFPRVALAGLSDPWGFTLYGHVTRDAIDEAVGEALQRLQAGQEALAIHPNCGTNLTTSIFLATAAALIGSAGKRRTLLDKMTVTIGLVTLALLIAEPLGMRFQRYTTCAAVGDRGLAQITPLAVGGRQAHRITFLTSIL
jgi:hypothetical protein